MRNFKNHNVKRNFARQLKKAMEAKGLTSKDVATAAGVSTAMISLLLNRKQYPTISAASRIAAILNIEL